MLVPGMKVSVEGCEFLGRGVLIGPKYEDRPNHKWWVEFPESVISPGDRYTILVKRITPIPPLVLIAEAAADQEESIIPKQKSNLTRPNNVSSAWNVFREQDIPEVRVLIKTRAYGTIPAMRNELLTLGEGKARLTIVSNSAGDIHKADVFMAETTKAAILGMGINIHKDVAAKAFRSGVVVKLHDTIYEIRETVIQLLEEVIEPKRIETPIGIAEVKRVIKSSKIGKIAGCKVKSGIVRRSAQMRVMRDGIVLWQGKLKGLKRFNEDVSAVKENFECGVALSGFSDVRVGDVMESVEVKFVKQKLTRQENNNERSGGNRNQGGRGR